jgi:hypothetical protein
MLAYADGEIPISGELTLLLVVAQGALEVHTQYVLRSPSLHEPFTC